MTFFWYKVGRRYFQTTLCGFNDVVEITFHNGCTIINPYGDGHDIAVEPWCFPRKRIKRFLGRCTLIGKYRSGGIPADVLNAVYKDLPVPDYRKNPKKIGEQFCLSL